MSDEKLTALGLANIFAGHSGAYTTVINKWTWMIRDYGGVRAAEARKKAMEDAALIADRILVLNSGEDIGTEIRRLADSPAKEDKCEHDLTWNSGGQLTAGGYLCVKCHKRFWTREEACK